MREQIVRVRLDSYNQRLPDEDVKYLFVSYADWFSSPEVQNNGAPGKLVPIFTIG